MGDGDTPGGLEVVTGEIVPAPEIVGQLTAAPTSREDHSGATSDVHLVALWLDPARYSPHTLRAYSRAANGLLTFLGARGRGLRTATLDDLRTWQAALIAADETRRPTPPGEVYVMSAGTRQQVAAVKSLFSAGQTLGYLLFNVTARLALPKERNRLAGRILSEAEFDAICAAATPDELIFIELLYFTACRVSEFVRLRWSDVTVRGDTSIVLTVHGKGGKTRHVQLPPGAAKTLLALCPALNVAGASARYVFETRTGGHLDTAEVWRAVHAAVERSGIAKKASPHWFRHAHASHALDHGAPVHLVMQTLGHASLATTTGYVHANPAESSSNYLRRKHLPGENQ